MSCDVTHFPPWVANAEDDPQSTWLFSPKLVTATFLPSIPFRIEVPSADVVGGPLAGSRRVRPAAEAWPRRHRAARRQAVRSMMSGIECWRRGGRVRSEEMIGLTVTSPFK